MRKLSIEAAIAELLYGHTCVIIPQLGGFVREYRPAGFDYVQGKISPPSSTLSFNGNLVVDDGLLLGHYKAMNGLSLAEAQQDLSDFSQRAKFTLADKEVVSIPTVGRLLKDYEGHIRFISENHNFNTGSFGLPELRYYPILREVPREKQEGYAPVTQSPQPEPPSPRRSQRLARLAIPVFVGLVLVSAVLWFWPGSHSPNGDGLADAPSTADPSKIPVINISPHDKEAWDGAAEGDFPQGEDLADATSPGPSAPANAGGEEEEGAAPADEAPESGQEDGMPDEGLVDAPPPTSAYTIYVGLFRYQAGVDKMQAAIVANGWVPVVRELSNGRKKIGVEVPYGDDAQVLLRQVRAKIEEEAFLSRN